MHGTSEVTGRYRAAMRGYLGLGGNLGDAAATLAWAVRRLDQLPRVRVRVRAVSPLYATAPWGVTEQPEFRNAAVAVDIAAPSGPAATTGEAVTALALRLLAALKDIEREAGRADGRRWGPRALDLDILVLGRHRVLVERGEAQRSLDADDDPAKAARPLEIPHRDLGERLFVLAPLADLAPRLVPPGWHETVETRRRAVAGREPAGTVRVVGSWDGTTGDWRQSSATATTASISTGRP